MARLLSTLSAAGTWVTAGTLSKRVGTTERTIRNYVGEINARGIACVESSKFGYRLTGDAGGLAVQQVTTPSSQRTSFILSRMLNASGPISLFDLADELYISESTLTNTTLPALRKLLARFDMTLDMHDFQVQLGGTEKNLRRLIGYAATHSRSDYFTSVRSLRDMFPSYDVDQMLESLVGICQDSGLFLNNYALSNLLVHLIIILVRLRSGNSLQATSTVHTDEIIQDPELREAVRVCVGQIQEYAKSAFHVSPSKDDYRQMATLIALSSDVNPHGRLSRERIVSLAGEELFDAVTDALNVMRDRYGLGEFDEEFTVQLALHVHNACQRISYGVTCPNPIASQLKQDYAPVYDMAVFLVHRLSQTYDMEFSEDEIGFIAYHLGAYLESHKPGTQAMTCVVVFENYHDFADAFVRRIDETLHGELKVKAVLDVGDYLERRPPCDIVIATIGFPHIQPHTILLSPLLSNRSVRKIRDEINAVARERRSESARRYLQRYLVPELYLRNGSASNADDCIRLLGSLCVRHGFITDEFVSDVLLRESISNTAYTDVLAVPHAINKFAIRSFVAVLHNDEPIPWGDHSVNFIMLIGLDSQDIRYFQDVLDLIIEIFMSPERSSQALETRTYDELVRVLMA